MTLVRPMNMKYLPVGLPQTVVTSRISVDLSCQILQKEYFEVRTKLGPEVAPAVFEPVFEPEESLLCTIFIAPGENHLVFRDEIAPTRLWDEWYRGVRIRNLGRASDIESIEIGDNEVTYHWCFSLANLYETGMHYSGSQRWTGKIYSSTWNHMLNNGAQIPILLRGGYREMHPEIYSGDRDAAEEYAKSFIG